MKINKELLNINKDFFNNFRLKIVKGKFVQRKTLKKGDPLLSCKQNDFELYYSGTLGGFVRKNDNNLHMQRTLKGSGKLVPAWLLQGKRPVILQLLN